MVDAKKDESIEICGVDASMTRRGAIDANEIRRHYSPSAKFLSPCDVQLEEVEKVFKGGNPLALLSGLVYADIAKRPLPDWLFAGLVTLLIELALDGTDAAAPSRISACRRDARQFMIDRVRYSALLHIRNIQGRGRSHPVTRGLNPAASRSFLAKIGSPPSDFGQTWRDAYLVAYELFADTIYAGNEDTMKKAHGRFKNVRADEIRRGAYWISLRELLDIPDAPTGGVT